MKLTRRLALFGTSALMLPRLAHAQITQPAPVRSVAGLAGAVSLSRLNLAAYNLRRWPTPNDDATVGYALATSTTMGSLWLGPDGTVLQAQGSVAAGVALWAPLSMQAAPLPGNAASVAPRVAYGTSRIVAAYTGPLIRVQRASDSTQIDINALSDGSFDWATFSAFARGTTVGVAKLYDQMGGGVSGDAVQATFANMLLITPEQRFGRSPALVTSSPNTSYAYRYLAIPDAVATTKNAVSFVGAFRSLAGFNYHSLLQIGNMTGADAIQIIVGPAVGTVPAYGGNATPAGGNYVSQTGDVVSFVSPSSGSRVVKVGSTGTASGLAYSAVALVGGVIGAVPTAIASHSVQAQSTVEIGSLVIYASALSVADETAVTAAIIQQHDMYPQAVDQILVVGESNSVNQIQLTGYGMTRQLAARFNGIARVISAGQGGIGVATMLTQYGTAAYYANSYNAAARNNVLYLNPGANDFWGGGVTAATVWGYISSFISAAKATGWKVVVGTLIDRSAPPANGYVNKNALSALIRANAGSLGYTVADIAASPQIGPDGVAGTAPYFADGAHLDAAGGAVAMEIITAAIASVWT